MSREFHRVEFGSARPAGPPAAGGGPPPADETAPPETNSVLVPVDQWSRILGQLGNIHEAGQQLADARERMARAETENEFLKERIRDLRARLEEADATRQPESAAPGPDDVAPRRRLQLDVALPRWMARRRG